MAYADGIDFHASGTATSRRLFSPARRVKVAMELARHSDPKLTMNVYSHLTVHDVSQGLDGLAHTYPQTLSHRDSPGPMGNRAFPVLERPRRTHQDIRIGVLVLATVIGTPGPPCMRSLTLIRTTRRTDVL